MKKNVFLALLLLMGIMACTSKKAETKEMVKEKPATGLEIDEKNFPDGALRASLLGLDEGKDGILTDEEINELKRLDLSNLGIIDMTGIGRLKARFLNVDKNPLKVLDLTDCLYLTEVSCCDMPDLRTILLGEQPRLEILNFSNDNVTEIDVTKCPELKKLLCYNSPVATIDLSGCPKLQQICCDLTLIPALDLTACPNVQFVDDMGDPID